MLRLWIIAALLASCLSDAQVTGTFSLDKSAFARGEPVFLSLTIHNDGKQALEIITADPYSFCSGYDIHVIRDGAPAKACFSSGFGGSCPSGAIMLAPNATHTERVLLNFRNTSNGSLVDPVSLPGNYTIDASRAIRFAPRGSDSRLLDNPDGSEVHQVLTLHVDETSESDPAVYAAFVQQLASKDDRVRREAARALATLAPPALEPLLLSFATSKDNAIKQFGPLALSNLATTASLAALAKMLISTESGSYESISAADYLGRTHDSNWLPLLLSVADRQGSMYLAYAAESGGEAALPALLARLHSTEHGTRNAAIYALGHTGSRAAIPLLISLLSVRTDETEKDGFDDAATANAALQELTHFYIDRSQSDTSVDSWHRRWQQWWVASGLHAPLYRPGECAENKELP